jgi:hypothetical protein
MGASGFVTRPIFIKMVTFVKKVYEEAMVNLL